MATRIGLSAGLSSRIAASSRLVGSSRMSGTLPARQEWFWGNIWPLDLLPFSIAIPLFMMGPPSSCCYNCYCPMVGGTGTAGIYGKSFPGFPMLLVTMQVNCYSLLPPCTHFHPNLSILVKRSWSMFFYYSIGKGSLLPRHPKRRSRMLPDSLPPNSPPYSPTFLSLGPQILMADYRWSKKKKERAHYAGLEISCH